MHMVPGTGLRTGDVKETPPLTPEFIAEGEDKHKASTYKQLKAMKTHTWW